LPAIGEAIALGEAAAFGPLIEDEPDDLCPAA
jgi:hypothetical protein